MSLRFGLESGIDARRLSCFCLHEENIGILYGEGRQREESTLHRNVF